MEGSTLVLDPRYRRVDAAGNFARYTSAAIEEGTLRFVGLPPLKRAGILAPPWIE